MEALPVRLRRSRRVRRLARQVRVRCGLGRLRLLDASKRQARVRRPLVRRPLPRRLPRMVRRGFFRGLPRHVHRRVRSGVPKVGRASRRRRAGGGRCRQDGGRGVVMEVTLSDVTCERECRRDELRVAYAFGGGVGSGRLYVDESNESCDRATHEFQHTTERASDQSPLATVQRNGRDDVEGRGVPGRPAGVRSSARCRPPRTSARMKHALRSGAT